jgi:hypothetical protein
MVVLAMASTRLDDWGAIHDAEISLVLEEAPLPSGTWVDALLAKAPFVWRAEAEADKVADAIEELPPELRLIVRDSAGRFARLMQADHLALRVEGVVGNACTRVHADYTDVRLIRTLAGPGTDYAPPGADEGKLKRVPTGWTGLFKGVLYPSRNGQVHAPCLHRSPPIEGSGEVRLVLVIDTVRR